MRISLTLLAFTILTGSWNLANSEPLVGAPMKVVGRFAGKDDAIAKDLSGIACLDQSHGQKQCLVINDENTAAQLIKIEDDAIIAGKIIPLIDEQPPIGAHGVPPQSNGCTGGEKKFKDLDGEGVAVSGGSFLVAGSHGCSRQKSEFRLSSFLLVRVELGNDGETRKIEWTYRLSDYLRAAPAVSQSFAQPLDETHHGLNIEGIAALGDQLLVGLRAPSKGDKAFIVAVPIEALFAEKPDTDAKPKVIALPLGRKTGIRDLTTLPDGRVLVLAGPTREQKDVPFSIHLADPSKDFATIQLATLEDVMDGDQRAKAEAITVLEAKHKKLRLLVLFDGVPNGMPREYVVLLE